jgi:hypothetical protein
MGIFHNNPLNVNTHRAGGSGPFGSGRVSIPCLQPSRNGHFGGIEAKKQRGHVSEILFPIKSTNDKNMLIKTQNIPASRVILFTA